MKGVLIALAIVGVLVLIVGGCTMMSYNGLVGAENNVEKTWANVQTAYQQRLDTLPKFAQVAKLSVQFQIELQERYVAARNRIQVVGGATDPEALQKAVDEDIAALMVGMRSLINLQVEATPEAKTEQLTELNVQIESVERVIKHERDAYNDAVKTYKDRGRKFPGSITVGMFGFDVGKYNPFQASHEAQTSPELDIDFNSEK